MTSAAPIEAAEAGSTALDRADRAPIAHRSRTRTARQQQLIIAAARRLIMDEGASFTTQELIKEAGVALQTFYRYFAGKDQLLLAVFEDLIAEAAETLEEAARDVTDPVERLHGYVTTLLRAVDGAEAGPAARFVTVEHWRLHQTYPEEIAAATQPVADLFERELREATDQGLLSPDNPAQAAWLTTRLVMSVFHHYAFVAADVHRDDVGEDVWSFCLAAFGGRR